MHFKVLIFKILNKKVKLEKSINKNKVIDRLCK